MKRIAAIVAALAWAACAMASAQTPNPILQHYRAYQAALEANDLVAAEREAAAALAASEARDGDGGRTAVLAFNLASVRFQNRNAEGALELARRALALAETRGEAAGVSPILARLLVGRAELALNNADGAARVSEALASAEEARLASEEIFDAAVELAGWSFTNRRFGEARGAWAIAASYAEGSRYPAAYALGRARIGEASSLLLEELESSLRNRPRLSNETASEAYRKLAEALEKLRPLAEQDRPDLSTTVAQRTYAEALAWRAVLHAKLRVDRQDIPEMQEAQGDADGLSEIASGAPMAQPRCLLDVTLVDRARRYPHGMYGNLAGVAVLLRVSEAGEVLEAVPVAYVGRREFAEALDIARHWRVQRRDDSPPNCRMAMNVIHSVSFG